MPAGPATGLNLQTRTRQQATEELASWIGAHDDPRLQYHAGLALTSAVRRCNAYRWTFNRRSQTITLVDSKREYPLDTIFRSQLGANISDDQGRPAAILPYKPYQDYLKDYPQAESSTEIGTPSLYTVRSPESDAVLRVAPMPITGSGAGKLIVLQYHTLIAFANSPNEPLLVPQGVDEAIFWMAMLTFLGGRDATAPKMQTAKDMIGGLWPQILFEFQDHGEIELIPWNTPV